MYGNQERTGCHMRCAKKEHEKTNNKPNLKGQNEGVRRLALSYYLLCSEMACCKSGYLVAGLRILSG